MTYPEQLQHPLWQKKRLLILERDKWKCQICLDTDTQLQVHHKHYDKTYQTMAWNYPDHVYQTLCSVCHKALTEHIKNFGNDEDFDLIKIKLSSGEIHPIVYTNGFVFMPNSDIIIPELESKKIVQFLINNWLKNG